jgi:hypothetical protein
VIRLVTLVNVLANLIQSNLEKSIGCQGWLYFEFVRTVLMPSQILCEELTCIVVPRFIVISDYCLSGDDTGFIAIDP